MDWSKIPLLALVMYLAGCGGGGSGNVGTQDAGDDGGLTDSGNGGSSSGGTTSGGSSSGGTSSGGTTSGGTSSGGTTSGGTSSGGSSSGGSSSGGSSSGGTSGGGTAGTGPGEPPREWLPEIYGTCPEFVVGEGTDVVFQTSRGDRPVRLWMSEAAKTLDGPLVFYWHGWHGSPGLSGITRGALNRLLEMGGMFVAPYVDPEAPSNYWTAWELLTADQVVACAIANVGIDKRHIHSIGYSAGGMQTYRMIHQRSGYLASAIMYSPGTNGGPGARQETENEIPTIITWGDTEDTIFRTLAEQYFDRLTGYGFFSMMCHHTGGHIQPSGVRDRALDFLLAHPYGVNPPPYAGGVPSDYPEYCGLTK
ncbi:MAG: hypothetical protein KIT72_05445 [Polyangiaceae bacterium]|nr:hypothetical protein [Polyangiaceae bacterium]MCW5789843.1 hypothetical protein [Polyangiaceae bacterium]